MKSEGFSHNDLAKFLAMRGVMPHDTCDRCGGFGTILYGNTSTYHESFIAGQAITRDACDKCWGSGTKTPWPSHSEYWKMRPVIVEMRKRFDDLTEWFKSVYVVNNDS
jgi:hypothetical protein